MTTTPTRMPRKATETATTPYPYQSVGDACRAYCAARERAQSIPSLDGVHLESVVDHWTSYGAPASEPHYVYLPPVDGGVGSVRDERIAGYCDVERCLPTDPLHLRVLLALAVYPQGRALALLAEWSGRRWYRRRLLRLHAEAYLEAEARLRARGLIPPASGEG